MGPSTRPVHATESLRSHLELVSRLALSPDEAARALGVSRDYFDEHVMPELRVVRRGRRRLVSLKELERWLHEAAARALERDHGDLLPSQNRGGRTARRSGGGDSRREESR
jgi:excisionase family DNA binding protein